MPDRPPVELVMEVEGPSGARFRWDSNQPTPGDRPTGATFRTKLAEGFSDAGLTLARNIDRPYPDLRLVNNVRMVGTDGTVAYEGRISQLPRTLGDSHSIGVTLTGWMAHARDRKFTEIYVDRDLGAWSGMSTARKAQYLALSRTPYDSETTSDPVDSEAAVATAWTGGWGATYFPIAEAWYDAGPGNTVSRIGYGWERESSNVNNADANWDWVVYLSSDTTASAITSSGGLRAPGPATLQTLTGAAARYAILQLAYNAGPVSADGTRFGVRWTKLAAYGNHGLTLRTGETGEPPGVTASDVIRDVARRWCPFLDTSGVQDTTYPIQHLVFRDPTDPYDAFLQVNKYHLFNLAVWENKRLDFQQLDLRDYDWEVRSDDQGMEWQGQGDAIDGVYNGVDLTYTNIATGTVERLTPETNPELADPSNENPWNQWGLDHWAQYTVSFPTLPAQALAIGQIVLAEQARPKAAGTLTVKSHVRDRAGNWQPAWKVRAGDTVAITTLHDDSPRLIHETTYDTDTLQLTLALDAPPDVLPAYMDRVTTALQARGLG